MGRRDFKNILKELNESGITIFFSSHIVSDVEEICNKVIFIEKGKLLYDGDIDSLILKHSNNDYKIKYVKGSIIETINVTEENKNSIIAQFLKDDISILEIEKDKPTLEEIIYKIKSK